MEPGYQSEWAGETVSPGKCGIIGRQASGSLGQIQPGSLLFCAAAALTGVLACKNPLWSIESYSGFSSMNGKIMMAQLSPRGLQHGTFVPCGRIL
jgi:hypothetical protein